MPVRSLNSSVLVWPDRDRVIREARRWARVVASEPGGVQRIGYFGSYARGDCGVGSDLDLVAIVERSDEPFVQRSARWPTETLPVPADLIVYTTEEWERLATTQSRFARALRRETI